MNHHAITKFSRMDLSRIQKSISFLTKAKNPTPRMVAATLVQIKELADVVAQQEGLDHVLPQLESENVSRQV